MSLATVAIDYQCEGIAYDPMFKEMKIDLSRPRKIRIVAINESGGGPPKEYFLKVTERRGLVLV